MQGESCKNALVHFYCRTVVYCALRNSMRLKISYDWRGMPVEFVHDVSDAKDAYDYRSFGEQITMTSSPTGKVTENFTGKELDDETQLDYFGARYLDPMLGVWISVDPMRQFASPYLYVGNGMNPVNAIDPDGKAPYQIAVIVDILRAESEKPTLDSYRDFQAAAKWGREKFGEDFEIRIIWNQKEMLDFVKAGKYTAIIAHTLLDRKGNPEQGTLVNREKDYDQIDLYRLDFDLFEINSYAKVFGCYVGSWYDDFANIDLGSNKDRLSMGDAYQGAADYLKDKGKNR